MVLTGDDEMVRCSVLEPPAAPVLRRFAARPLPAPKNRKERCILFPPPRRCLTSKTDRTASIPPRHHPAPPPHLPQAPTHIPPTRIPPIRPLSSRYPRASDCSRRQQQLRWSPAPSSSSSSSPPLPLPLPMLWLQSWHRFSSSLGRGLGREKLPPEATPPPVVVV